MTVADDCRRDSRDSGIPLVQARATLDLGGQRDAVARHDDFRGDREPIGAPPCSLARAPSPSTARIVDTGRPRRTSGRSPRAVRGSLTGSRHSRSSLAFRSAATLRVLGFDILHGRRRHRRWRRRAQHLPQQALHRDAAAPTHDERSRQEFRRGLRGYHRRRPCCRASRRYLPSIKQSHAGHGGADRNAIRRRMGARALFRHAAANRNRLALLWLSVVDLLERELPRLEAEAPPAREPSSDLLRWKCRATSPCSTSTAYARRLQCSKADPQRLAAGRRLYDRGVYLTTRWAMPTRTAMQTRGRSGSATTPASPLPGVPAAPHPSTSAASIGAPGLSAVPKGAVPGAGGSGASTIAACALRWRNNLRAVAMGYRGASLAQMNAERTGFPDGHFDLVVSHVAGIETAGVRGRACSLSAHHFPLLASGRLLRSTPTCPPFEPDGILSRAVLIPDNRDALHNNGSQFWARCAKSIQVIASRRRVSPRHRGDAEHCADGDPAEASGTQASPATTSAPQSAQRRRTAEFEPRPGKRAWRRLAIGRSAGRRPARRRGRQRRNEDDRLTQHGIRVAPSAGSIDALPASIRREPHRLRHWRDAGSYWRATFTAAAASRRRRWCRPPQPRGFADAGSSTPRTPKPS